MGHEFSAYLLGKRLSRRSVKIYAYWVGNALRSVERLDWEGALAYKAQCLNRHSPTTQRLVFSAVNHYLAFKGEGRKLPLPRVSTGFRKEPVSPDDYKGLCESMVFGTSFLNVRNQGIMRVLWALGLRVGELTNLKWEDIGEKCVKVLSKNNRSRMIPYQKGLFDDLRGLSDGPYVFCTVGGERLSYSSVYRLFAQMGRQGLSPHSMRHSFATRLLHRGIPVNYVSDLLGHASIETTMIYLHYGVNDIAEELEAKDWRPETALKA